MRRISLSASAQIVLERVCYCMCAKLLLGWPHSALLNASSVRGIAHAPCRFRQQCPPRHCQRLQHGALAKPSAFATSTPTAANGTVQRARIRGQASRVNTIGPESVRTWSSVAPALRWFYVYVYDRFDAIIAEVRGEPVHDVLVRVGDGPRITTEWLPISSPRLRVRDAMGRHVPVVPADAMADPADATGDAVALGASLPATAALAASIALTGHQDRRSVRVKRTRTRGPDEPPLEDLIGLCARLVGSLALSAARAHVGGAGAARDADCGQPTSSNTTLADGCAGICVRTPNARGRTTTLNACRTTCGHTVTAMA